MTDYATNETARTLWARGGKRLFDTLAAAILVIVLSPVLIVFAVLVKLSSPGPVLFAQEREVRDGRIIRPIKFRTMRGGRKPDPKERVPLDHADITRVGWFLRRFKLDELPQLFNVLSGEMSLVGPRPTLPDQVKAYDDFRRQRLLVRPGLTGLTQINGGASISWNQRILYDIAYVRRCSFGLDMGILLETLHAVVAGEEKTARRFEDTKYARSVPIPPGYEDYAPAHLRGARDA